MRGVSQGRINRGDGGGVVFGDAPGGVAGDVRPRRQSRSPLPTMVSTPQ